MFKGKTLQMKMVKDNDTTVTTQMLNIEPEKINQIVKASVKTIGIGIVAVVGSLIAIDAAAEIAVNAAPKNN